jgi:Transcriptional regulator PadR-like family
VPELVILPQVGELAPLRRVVPDELERETSSAAGEPSAERTAERCPVPIPRSRLTGFEQVLLGLICLQPSTGYDLKRRFATTALGVYQPSSGALDPALDRLEGLAEAGGDPYAALAVGHGLAVHRASLAWAGQAIARLTADSRNPTP